MRVELIAFTARGNALAERLGVSRQSVSKWENGVSHS